ncbi:indoleamine 2,3-dioxygenase 2-like protein [Labeo rohita]|uniref:Indoleamine 2,3-dioxygenase 2-like protein n=1 Tax=Labeo rohita TaxID=84645 RepID=A0A498LE66_LABRO|nr:indoleamine 2,3-dioxygenase 2-like protein [Labeo rohita]
MQLDSDCSQTFFHGSIIDVINGVHDNDVAVVIKALDVVSQALDSMKQALKLMHEYVDPSIFYGIMRIYLSGWKDNPLMPEGLVYEGVQEKPMEFSGNSAAQSSLLHSFDELLGVQHEGSSGAFLTRMRDYMPPSHKQFIEHISSRLSLRSFVLQQADEHLTQSFEQCVARLVEFRNLHINIVTRYITIPASRAKQLCAKNQDLTEELDEIRKAPTALEEKGTGGSGIMTFLKTMPLLETHLLQTHRELRLAHLALSIMTSGYVWQEGERETVKVLPRNLSVPFCEMSQRLGLPPILIHADTVLANWKKRDPNGNLDLLLTLPGGESVRGFFLVTLLVELAAVPGLKSIIDVINGVHDNDVAVVIKALDVVSQAIDSMKQALKLMHGAFLRRMRDYMPPSHKQFIEHIYSRLSLRSFVLQQADEHLTQSFEQCVARLVDFRNYHINIVTRYITIPASRAKQLRASKQGLAEELDTIRKAPTALEERGTGGSGIMTFLKTVRDETKDTTITQCTNGNQVLPDSSVTDIHKAASELTIE